MTSAPAAIMPTAKAATAIQTSSRGEWGATAAPRMEINVAAVNAPAAT